MQSSLVSAAAVADKRSVFIATEHLGRIVPVAELLYSMGRYTFSYTCGALHLGARTQVVPLPGLPNLTQRYHSKTLFPVFQPLVAFDGSPASRERWRIRGLDPEADGAYSMLALPTRLPTPQLLFTIPSIRGDLEGLFKCRFLVRGPGRGSPVADGLVPGQVLRAELVIADDGRRQRVALTLPDGVFIDWAPEFLAAELLPIWRSGLSLHVELLANHRATSNPDEQLLLEVGGRWPAGYTPMNLLVFAPIVI
ncbi:MAG: hypothetical protein R3F58_14940 [Steroidobacteraceae bacterium]|nr:hypothetical protein [Steroidobacteraceae bacterium]